MEIIQSQIEHCEPWFGFCHGDLHRGNVHINANTPTIFDFDCMGYGYRAYDICIYAWDQSFHNHEYLGSDEWKTYMEGYETVQKLTEAEKLCIPVFMALRQVWMMGLHADAMNRIRYLQSCGSNKIESGWVVDETKIRNKYRIISHYVKEGVSGRVLRYYYQKFKY